MSEGDKNTLAFALFLAKLDQMPPSELSKKVVVIDDPITSLDTHRRRKTVEAICKFHSSVKQIVVLSHDAVFLHDIWKHRIWSIVSISRPSHLQIVRAGSDESEFITWAVDEAIESDYFMNFKMLNEYLSKGSLGSDSELRNIAGCIRRTVGSLL